MSYAETNFSSGPGILEDLADSTDAGVTWTYHSAEDFPYFLQVSGNFLPLVDADFNDDGLYDCLDVDSLVAEIAAGTQNLAFDLTADSFVDIHDLDQWRADAGAVNLASQNPYLPGDANLDGAVDGADFNIWNGNKFSSVAAWCSGDFSADGAIDGSDFAIWNGNKFTAADSAVVPEPLVWGWSFLSLLVICRR